jgi:CRISPR-associated endoribonuclease Cas6
VIFSDSNFHEQMNNTTKKLLSTYGYDLKSDIYLENIDLKKTVVKTVNSGTLQTNQPILTFTSNTGNLKLIGDKKALELIYKNGFGIKSSQGFGMLEVV